MHLLYSRKSFFRRHVKYNHKFICKNGFGIEENIKYVKNYLIENRINGIENESEAGEEIKDKKYFEVNFQKPKKLESKDFVKKFLDATLFSLETNESPFTLNDIKK